MDRLIRRFESRADADLMVCDARGIAYQRDMSKGRVQYDDEYAKKFDAYDGDISRRVTAGRLDLVTKHMPARDSLIDWGCGSGQFLRAAIQRGISAAGYELIPCVAAQLIGDKQFSADPSKFDAVCAWDVLEHLEDPGAFLDRLRKGTLLFVSLPIFSDLNEIRESKHYRPGEHFHYFTRAGFSAWAALYGYRVLEVSEHEIVAGRESVLAFVLLRDLPDYHDYIAAYDQMHAERFYGSSAVELHFGTVAKIVSRVKPKSILDFGCGRSDLVAHFWLDGKRTIERYDPAIRKYRHMPGGKFDLVLCCDVMEHIPMASIDTVLGQIKSKGSRCLFTISMKPARAKLPDGSNAHCTLLNTWEWIKWMRSYFPKIETLPSEWDTELLLYCHSDK